MPCRRLALRFMCALSLVVVSILSAAPAAGKNSPAEDKTDAAEAAHPVLVELFTSEGCSSCPPADALLEKLDASQPVPGAQLIVLSEHVDYWDHDGWKDPNSSPFFTERQQAYIREFHMESPYTPQLIVDGTTVLPTDKPQQFERIFEQAAAIPKLPVRIADVSLEGGSPAVLHTRIEADGSSEKHDAEIYLAVALDHVESQVLHGENGGRRLTHVAVVTQLAKVGKLKKGKTFNEPVELKLKSGMDAKNLRIVVFVQESGPGQLLGAALHRPTS